MIFSGALTETLKFYHIVEVQTGSGFKKTEETLFWTCRAERTKNKESYGVDADELFHINTLTFYFRYNRDITERDIVVYNEERYRILSLVPYPRSREMQITVEKINE